MAAPLTVYGVPFSQPVRAVLWACLIKKLPFRLAIIGPGSTSATRGTRGPAFLAKNPSGTVPVIEEPDGFTLGESGAILPYLADKHGWHDLYGDPATEAGRKRRAKVDWYLHAHHRGARESFVHVIPHMRKDKIKSGRFPPELLAAGAKNFDAAVRALETGWLRHSEDVVPQSLAPRPFLNVGRVVATGPDDAAFDPDGSGRGPSLADIVCYSELGPLAPELNDLYDFRARGAPRVAAWLDAMRGVEAHDAAFAINAALGPLADGRDVTLDRIKDANAAAAAAIAAADPQSSIDFGAKLEPLEEE